ncbi:MAG: hypothetical protein E6H47_14815 [Betaproteobacteria bacterium]|nr:MAG: hypothetical protein E6H47_14815 [Betaproteobacteria bacterium]
MRKPSKMIAALALVAGAMTATSAFAWHHRSHVFVGFNFGFPVWGAPYYAPPYYYPYPAPVYYPAPVAVAPAAPPVYVERSEPAPQQQGMWYYCEQARGYYPYVTECPGGWKAVPPAPPPAR